MQRFDFIKNKRYAFIFSITLMVIFAIMFFVNGVVLDITFRGGTRMMFETVATTDANKAGTLIEQTLSGKKVSASLMKAFSDEGTQSTNATMLRIDVAGEKPLTEAEEQKVKDVLKANFDIKLDSPKNQIISIEPAIGKQMLTNGVLAVVISSILILIYVAWRFSVMSGFSAAVCAIIALLHDVAVMFCVYIAFKLPFNDIFIAAVLTVIGYSINDTIIVYDRIRENAGRMKKADYAEIVNASIWQTMARSINTLVTVLICIVCILIFATLNNIQSLKDFGLSLTVGITTGGYSSIFIASPLWQMWREKKLKAQVSK
ncbi:MAG: protein translocase subunit SecF [Clostridia bacterium]|nr:protein translocase subunit SecF [Clostridia bacterium]